MEKKKRLKRCPVCHKLGYVNKEGDVLAFGCFYCLPAKLPRKPHW